MYKSIKKKGMTLLEVIIAMAILSVILVAFLTLFTGGVSTIFGMGHKTKAVEEAQALIDMVCDSKEPNSISMSCHLSNNVDIYKYDKNYKKKYCVEEYSINNGATYDYYKVTVAVFYNNGKNYTKLAVIVPKGGSESGH